MKISTYFDLEVEQSADNWVFVAQYDTPKAAFKAKDKFREMVAKKHAADREVRVVEVTRKIIQPGDYVK